MADENQNPQNSSSAGDDSAQDQQAADSEQPAVAPKEELQIGADVVSAETENNAESQPEPAEDSKAQPEVVEQVPAESKTKETPIEDAKIEPEAEQTVEVETQPKAQEVEPQIGTDPSDGADIGSTDANKATSEVQAEEIQQAPTEAEVDPQISADVVSPETEARAESQPDPVETSEAQPEAVEPVPADSTTEEAPTENAKIEPEAEQAAETETPPEETEQTETEEVVETETPAATATEAVVAEENPQPETQPEAAPVEVAEEEFEIIQGVTPRPGDKVETTPPPPAEPAVEPETEAAQEPQTPPAADKQQPDSNQFQAGFKPDGTTPLDAEEKLFSAIGYISFLALLPFFTRKDSEFAQHHARQALVIFIIIFLFTLLFSFSGTMRGLAGVLTIAIAIGGGMFAYKGEWLKVPVIYDLSLKLKVKPQSSNPQQQAQNYPLASEKPAEAPTAENPPPPQEGEA